ncbi:MAG: hypothetical protein JW793_02950 [Acidobacteria bacterium]|nr:hypothetical protein [Acidobacteriota bacterium]
MKKSSTEHHSFADSTALLKCCQSAVSLHGHTLYSRESIHFLLSLSGRSPTLSRLIERKILDHWNETGERIDFNRVHWTPPVLPSTLFVQEANQITQNLGLNPLVSITDHDCTDGCIELNRPGSGLKVPVSLEWTVPFEGGRFHIGIHNIPENREKDWSREFREYTENPVPNHLKEILAGLNSLPQTLLVLNHPLWDIADVGQKQHECILENFWNECGSRIHAIEFNGFRSPEENKKVLAMGRELDVPVVSGGDRHGRQANTVLNLTRAETFSDFVREIRDRRHSALFTMPSHHEPLLARTIETAEEAIRKYPKSCGNPRVWTDRVFVETELKGVQPLSTYWRSGGPWWLRSAMSIVRLIGCPQIRPALRWALAGKDNTT